MRQGGQRKRPREYVSLQFPPLGFLDAGGSIFSLVDLVFEVGKVGHAPGPFSYFQGGAGGEVDADDFGSADLFEDGAFHVVGEGLALIGGGEGGGWVERENVTVGSGVELEDFVDYEVWNYFL